MENYSHFIFARALHIAAIVFWIGGVAFVTTVLIPALKNIPEANDRLELFEKLEGKFGFQAKITTLINAINEDEASMRLFFSIDSMSVGRETAALLFLTCAGGRHKAV